MTAAFQHSGRALILLGGLGECDDLHFGGTQYAKYVIQSLWGLPPKLDMDLEKRVQTAIRTIVAEGLAESAHDLGDGGLAVALAESRSVTGSGLACSSIAICGPNFCCSGKRRHESWFRRKLRTGWQAIAKANDVVALRIGDTIEGELIIRNRDTLLINRPIALLRERWSGALENLLHSRT